MGVGCRRQTDSLRSKSCFSHSLVVGPCTNYTTFLHFKLPASLMGLVM